VSQNKRPVRPGGMQPRGSAPSGQPTARPVTVQVRSITQTGQPSANQRPVNPAYPANGARPAPARPNSPRPAAARPAAAQRPAAQPRPAAPRSAAPSRLPFDFMRLVGIAVLVVALGVAAQLIWPNGFSIGADKGAVEVSAHVSEIHGEGPIRINELMSSNDGTAVDENGATADWIEIMNVGSREINLSGYSLAKNQNAANVFKFPDHALQPGECAIVFADSTLAQEAGRTYHAPFRLSSQGGSLMLFSASGSAIDSVNFPAMTADMAYARQDQSTWSVTSMATPGMDNSAESYTALHQARTDSGVEITEIVSSNTKVLADENGEYYDYFEIHNATGAAIDMSGWFVSDTVGAPTKWRLPEGFVLQAGEYRVIYASGLDRGDASYPHAGFGLSSEGEAVVLADSEGRVVGRVEFGLLGENVAWKKAADGSWTTGTPTPGAAN